jgi:hypothetical protein
MDHCGSSLFCTYSTTSTSVFLTYVYILMRSMARLREDSAELLHLFCTYFMNSLSYGSFIMALRQYVGTRRSSCVRFNIFTIRRVRLGVCLCL